MLTSVLLHAIGTGLSIGSRGNAKNLFILEVNEQQKGQTTCTGTCISMQYAANFTVLLVSFGYLLVSQATIHYNPRTLS